MIDYNNIPANVDKQVFDPNPSWQTWRKPKGYTMADILLIGGGGNGGTGFNGSGTIGLSGAGGGASACLLKMQIPFYFIPDTLFLLVGRNTESTFLSCSPNTTASNLIGIASAGGSAGSPTAGGAAAPALINTGTTNPRYLSLCNWISIGGIAGVAGGTLGATGGGYTMNTQSILNPGTGGAGKNIGTPGSVASFSGGPLTVLDILPSFFKNVAQSITGAPGVSGTPPGTGFQQFKPFISYGGLGGCGGSGVGAQGGSRGTIGSGGGGGGSGNGGAGGGAGGFGLAIITSY